MKNLLRQFIKYFVQWYLLLGMLCTNPRVTCLNMGKAQTIST